MSVAEDLTPFFSEFAEQASIGGARVTALVDMPYALGDVGMMGMATTALRLTVRTQDIDEDTIVGARATVRDAGYVVMEHRPDGTGISALFLERSP